MTLTRAAAIIVGVMAVVGACAAGGGARSTSGPRSAARDGRSRWEERIIRVALATATPRAAVSASGDWRLFSDGGGTLVARAKSGETWFLERAGRRIRGVRSNGSATDWLDGPFVVSAADEEAPVSFEGRGYRGELWIAAVDSGLRVINRVFVEDYLRSVVPAEIGGRTMAEHAAVEAQAVAARSYAYTRLGDLADTRGYDLVAGVTDQVYRGVSAERTVSDIAVAATSGLVLYYDGRAVSAPYSANCGGSTASAGELWRTLEEPYLQRVSDRVPGTDRFYCGNGPRFKWTRTLDGEILDQAMAMYLRRYARAGAGPVGTVRDIRIDGRTASGRAAAIIVQTDAGTFRVRGNDTRYVLRPPNGEILNSTYFTLATDQRGGRVRSVTMSGGGNGHGVGMCQWGAIGRARAGHDFRAILRTYYPGTTIAPAR